MAIRVFSQKELYAELEKIGFKKTSNKTDLNTIWINEDGEAITVKHNLSEYPAYYVDELLHHIGVNCNPSGQVVDLRKYHIQKK